MSLLVPLEAIPNQSLSIQLDNIRYELRFRDIGQIMCADISINEEKVIQGVLVTGNSALIPYEYLENGGGNFLFITEKNENPYWKKFGDSQFLLYVTVDELGQIRGN